MITLEKALEEQRRLEAECRRLKSELDAVEPQLLRRLVRSCH